MGAVETDEMDMIELNKGSRFNGQISGVFTET